MKLMKKVRLGTHLFSAALLMSANSVASTVTIYNNNFDALALDDGNSSAKIHHWEVTSGIAGIHNPGEALFSGEGGAGLHNNTLYMIDNSAASQTLNFKAQAFSLYNLRFDVGQRADMPTQNYSVKVLAGDKTLLWATNPDFPSAPGGFKAVDVQFETKELTDDYLTVVIETEGSGHLHFDNFALATEQAKETQTEYYRTVARYSYSNIDGYTVQTSLKQKNGQPYLETERQCKNSFRVEIATSTNPDGSYTNHGLCIIKSNQ